MTNILIADDERDIIELVDVHLKQEGYQTIVVEDGMRRATSLLGRARFDSVGFDAS